MLTSSILSDAYAKVESRGLYGEKVVKLWMNRSTYHQVRKYCRDILELCPTEDPDGSSIITHLNQDNLGTIWGVPIRTSESIPDQSLLVLSEKDSEFIEGQVPDKTRIFRW